MGLSATAGEPLGSIGFKSVINECKWQNKCGGIKKIYRLTTSIHQKKKNQPSILCLGLLIPAGIHPGHDRTESLLDIHTQSYVIRNIKQYFEDMGWLHILAPKRRPWQRWSLQRDSAACEKRESKGKVKSGLFQTPRPQHNLLIWCISVAGCMLDTRQWRGGSSACWHSDRQKAAVVAKWP